MAQTGEPLSGPTVSRTALPTVTMRSGNISFAEVLPKWEVLSRKATTAKSVSASLYNAPAQLTVSGQRYQEESSQLARCVKNSSKSALKVRGFQKTFQAEVHINEH
jgi:hypothetical protein